MPCPTLLYLAFTGTPLIAGEEKTRQVFGDYVSIYDFGQSVEDNATVPLYYENRIPELQLSNEDFNEDMEKLLEDAELDENQEPNSSGNSLTNIISSPAKIGWKRSPRILSFISWGAVSRARQWWFAIDKATAMSMYDKVKKYWNNHLVDL